MKKRHKTCTSGKSCYKTYKRVTQIINRARVQRGRTLYKYVCPYCGFYHVTMVEQSEYYEKRAVRLPKKRMKNK